MKKVIFLSSVILLISAAVLEADEKKLEQVIQDIQQKVQDINSYQTNIEMVFLKSPGDVMEIEGYIKFVKPDKLSTGMSRKGKDDTWQYMYSDGLLLWEYRPFFKLASKVDLAALKEEFPNADELVRDQSNIENAIADIEESSIKYLGIETLGDEDVYVFGGRLSSREEDRLGILVGNIYVKIWVSTKDGLQRMVEYYDEDNSNKVIFYKKLKDVKTDIEIPDSEFQFHLPQEVSILDNTPQAREKLRKSSVKDEQ